MSAPKYRTLTLALHPSSRGFGWVAFENPFSIDSCGTVGTRGSDKNARCLKRLERLLRRLQPETIVIEAFEAEHSRRASRITNLGRAIVALSMTERIEVAIFRHKEVQQIFAHLGARTRQEIAEAVARLLPELRRYLPRGRKAWESEQWRMSLFCAAALGLTNYQRVATRFLDEFGSPGL